MKPEIINHPSHYRPGKHEAIDVIEEWQLGFCLGNTVKYIARHVLKGSPLEDLRKARWYLDREISMLEREASPPPHRHKRGQKCRRCAK